MTDLSGSAATDRDERAARVCEHGLPCTRHAVKRQSSEVLTHVAIGDDGRQHRFWFGSAGWTCVVVGPADLEHMMPLEAGVVAPGE